MKIKKGQTWLIRTFDRIDKKDVVKDVYINDVTETHIKADYTWYKKSDFHVMSIERAGRDTGLLCFITSSMILFLAFVGAVWLISETCELINKQ